MSDKRKIKEVGIELLDLVLVELVEATFDFVESALEKRHARRQARLRTTTQSKPVSALRFNRRKSDE